MSRISDLPRRCWEDLVDDEFLVGMTNLLRTSVGTQQLRPIQAVGLAELGQMGGGFFAMSVGEGKTLISGLAPVVLQAKNALVVVPSNLVEKTKREFEQLRLHWKIPYVNVVGYRFFSTKKNTNWLVQNQPDVIIFDEAHALKTAKATTGGAAVAKRFNRYFAHFPKTKVVAMTGTVEKDSILDYAHIIDWCLKEGSPLPRDPGMQETWAACLDVQKGCDLFRPSFKVLWPDLGEVTCLEAAREAYAERLGQTPGVIISNGYFNDVRLHIYPTYAPDIPEHDADWEKMQQGWIAPDDYPLGDSKAQVWAMSRDFSRGYFRKHVPWPPDYWMAARKGWTQYVRHVCDVEGTLWDTEAQVREACLLGTLHSDAYLLWRDVEPEFTVHRETEWRDHRVTDFIIEDVLNKFENEGGIVWTWQTPLAADLAQRSGWRYFGDMGLDASGLPIESADPKEIVIASIKANGTGRNLQFWRNNYVTCPPPANYINEQMLGRTHRPGAKRDVRAWYLFACRQDIEVFRMAQVEAEFAEQTRKQIFKLRSAEIEQPVAGFGAAYN